MKKIWLSKENCTGCGMCANICPRNAISIIEDKCGFFYPKINNLCVDCGICEKNCNLRWTLTNKNTDHPLAFAAWSIDPEIRFKSTSGGVFSEIARAILGKGGYVVGASYDDHNNVVHIAIRNECDLAKIRQSKYLQSFSGRIYSQVKELLDMGETVLFCGTPCQVAALYSFLNKPYNNLFTIDFICRGVNSPKAFKSWLNEIEKKYNSKVKNVWFKYKEDGWKASPYCSKISFFDNKHIVLSGNDNLFMVGYLGPNLYIRPSCAKCHFKGVPRLADITLADYWGIESEYDDDKGTSLVIINNEKGKILLDGASKNLNIVNKDFSDSIKYNPCYKKSVYISSNSEKFLRSLSYCKFSKALNKYANRENNSIFSIVNYKLSKIFSKVKRLINLSVMSNKK